MSRRNLLLLLVACAASYACYVRAEQNPYARYLAAGYAIVDRWALQDAPDQALFEGAMNGMIDVLHKQGDEHSQFVSSLRSESFREDISQEFGGIGIRVRLLGEPPMPTVVGPPEPGTPACDADIQSGDRLAAVDGASAAGKTLEEVTQMIRGPEGEVVTLTLQRHGAPNPHDVVITREVITVESVLGDLRDATGKWNFRLEEFPEVGFLRVTKFGDKTAGELSVVLAELHARPLAGLVIDLRDNYGGALDAAVEISDLFLAAGFPIVTTRGRDLAIRERYVSSGAGPYPDLPLAVLINQNSASASEIVAGCLQDYRRALVVGQRSYGKGTVQRLMRLESGRSLLKITSATYWRPSGRNIHRMPADGPAAPWGVLPDPGCTLVLDESQYLAWRRYRSRRDLFGSQDDPRIDPQWDEVEGAPPPGFRDRVLELAVAALLRGQTPEGPTP
jgi:carboxyl-terminal processing protease